MRNWVNPQRRPRCGAENKNSPLDTNRTQGARAVTGHSDYPNSNSTLIPLQQSILRNIKYDFLMLLQGQADSNNISEARSTSTKHVASPLRGSVG